MDIVTLAASKKYTDKKLAESAAVGIKYEIVDSLPSSGKEQTIYFVKNESSWINNYYDEYVWISSSGSFEKIGSTQLDDFIQNPSAAEVGQTIVVKEVNEEGKPIAWEMAELPEQAQADWNQNDSAAADYIKNRPFYGDLVIVPYPGVIGVAWYKVSDDVPTGDYSDGAACCVVVNGEKKNDAITYVTDELYTAAEMSIFISLNDNVTIEGSGVTIPKRGTYFIAIVGMPLITGFALGADADPEITWNGRASDIKTLDEKFFPSKMIILDASDGVTLVDENNNRINISVFTERIIKGDLPCYRNATTYVFSSEVSVDMKNFEIQVYNRFAGETTIYKISADSDGYITLDVYVE